MSEPKFTKGPWGATLHETSDGEVWVDVTTEYDIIEGDQNLGPETICTIGGYPTIPLDGGAEWEATGNLIAAAPDMYEALEEVCHDCIGKEATDILCEWCHVDKALRKARGETV